MTDTTQTYKPVIHIMATSAEVDEMAANLVAKQVVEKPHSYLTLPTGQTPQGMYKLLVSKHINEKLDFSAVTIFNLDEYWPIKKFHEASYASYMKSNLIDHINIQKANWHIPNGEASDPAIEASHYETQLQGVSIDLAILGIGPGKTCHIGFNERGSTVDSESRYIKLDEETKKTNSVFFPNASDIPEGAITQGVADILRAKKIVLIAKGEGKAWGLHRSIYGPISADAPASFLRYHPHLTVIIDKAAARML